MKHLLRIADLTVHDLDHLLERSEHFKHHPRAERKLLRGRTAVLYFAKPSTRTRISAETAMVRLGGTPITVGPAELQLGRGETIGDIARVISSYAAAVVIRTFSDSEVGQFARCCDVPLVNALTDGHHPLHSLAELMTIKERFGNLRGRKIAYVGAANNVTTSLMEAAALAGMDLAVASPAAYGGQLLVTDDPFEAVKGADAVYTDVWLSMGDADEEKAARVSALTPYRVTADMMARAGEKAIFTHCLPAHRGEEVDATVINDSKVFVQAANRLPTAQAVLEVLIT